ncbi:MAG: hypothetical protein R2911_23205 [Caldilineaceae bacterium]
MAANEPTAALPDQLFTDLEALIADAEKRHNVNFQSYLLTLQALAAMHSGQRAQAYTHLQMAFDLTESSEYLLCFLNLGNPWKRWWSKPPPTAWAVTLPRKCCMHFSSSGRTPAKMPPPKAPRNCLTSPRPPRPQLRRGPAAPLR